MILVKQHYRLPGNWQEASSVSKALAASEDLLASRYEQIQSSIADIAEASARRVKCCLVKLNSYLKTGTNSAPASRTILLIVKIFLLSIDSCIFALVARICRL